MIVQSFLLAKRPMRYEPIQGRLPSMTLLGFRRKLFPNCLSIAGITLFRGKSTKGASLIPSDLAVRSTVILVFSCPVVITVTSLDPFWVIQVPPAGSSHTVVSSAA